MSRSDVARPFADHLPSRLGAAIRARRGWLSDARHYQTASLGILLLFNIVWLDLGAHVLPSVLAIGSALLRC